MTSKTLSEIMAEEEIASAEVVTYLMHKHFPGWDRRATEFETFVEYTDWVEQCLDCIILQSNTRRDQ